MSAHPLPTRLPLRTPALLSVLDEVGPLLAHGADAHDRDGSFPHDNFALLQRHGLIGQVVPRAWGGGGAGAGQARQIVRAVARAEPATALVLVMSYLQHRAIGRPSSRWPAHLRERIGRSAVERGALVNTLRVEPALGSPTRGGVAATTARRTADGGWRIDGHKLYATGIPGLAWLLVWAREDTGDGADPAQARTGFFLVPRETPGIHVLEGTWDHLGMRASASHEVVLEDVRIPEDHALELLTPAEWTAAGRSPADQAAQADQLAWQALLLGTLYDAVAQAATDWLVGFLRERAPGSLGAPLAGTPRVQEAVGRIAALLHASKTMLNHVTDLVEDGAPPPPAQSALLKHSVTGHAVQAVELALQLSGNHGLSRRNPLERHYRNVLCGRVHTPQDDATLVAAGRALLGV